MTVPVVGRSVLVRARILTDDCPLWRLILATAERAHVPRARDGPRMGGLAATSDRVTLLLPCSFRGPSLNGVTSATTMDSSTVVVPERPTGDLPIAGTSYAVRCPKLKLWMTVLEHQKQSRARQALEPQIERVYERFIELNQAGVGEGEEVDKLLNQLSVLQNACGQSPNTLQLADIFLDFLGTCIIDKKQSERLSALYHSNDGDVDMPHLVIAVDHLNVLFQGWLYDQADFVGMEPPEIPERPAPNRAARRAKQPADPATSTPRKRASSRTR